MQLTEKYRPRSWDDLVGQDKAKGIARRLIERAGFDRGAFWIDCAGENNSGIGKSSLAWLLARTLADDWMIRDVSGSELTMTALKDFEVSAHLCAPSLVKPFRVLLVDEAHAIPAATVDRLLKFLECLPRHCAVIFTTTRKVDEGLFGDDAGPFASRCTRLRLTNQGVSEAFAARAQWIARQEDLDGAPIEKYVKLVRECKNNMRAVVQRIEAGEMIESGGAA
jgi:replication-associated recombination protein RarA